MTKLTDCLSVVKEISQEDSDAILSALEEYTDAGMVPSRAQVKAVNDVLRELNNEKAGYLEMIDEQLGEGAGQVTLQNEGNSKKTDLSRVNETDQAPEPKKVGDGYSYLGTGRKGAYFTLRYRYMEEQLFGRKTGPVVRDIYIANLGPNRKKAIVAALSKIGDNDILYATQKDVLGRGEERDADILKFGKYDGWSIDEVSELDPNYLAWLYEWPDRDSKLSKKSLGALEAAVESNEEIKVFIAEKKAGIEAEKAAATKREANKRQQEAANEWLIEVLEPQEFDSGFVADMLRMLRDGYAKDDFSPGQWNALRKVYAKSVTNRARVNTTKYKEAAEEFDKKAEFNIASPTKSKSAGDSDITSDDKITDVGEKLGGARKDAPKFISKEITDDDIVSQPLSKIWPKKEIDAVEDEYLAAFATVARGEIPRKPSKGYKLKAWVNKVSAFHGTMKSVFNMVADGRLESKDIYERMEKHPVLGELNAKLKLLSLIDRAQWDRIGRVELRPDSYSYDKDGGKIPRPHVGLYIDKSWKRIDGATTINEALDSVNEFLGKEASAKKMQFEIRGRTGRYFINKTGDSEYRKLKTFDDLSEAKTYLSEHNADLVDLWDEVKARDNVSKADVRNKINKPRTGKDYRDGKDVTAESFAETFGFRGVEFGNWVKQGKNSKERQGMINLAYDALMDLADIVGIPPKAVSLNGDLGLGFGSRGSGSASAHFEPGKMVINLTKTRGAGTFAHEWFHALDNYFQRSKGMAAGIGREDNYITYRPETSYIHKSGRSTMTMRELKRRREQHPTAGFFDEGNWNKVEGSDKIRPEVAESFADLVDRLNESPMAKRASAMDKGKDGYWSRIIERAARSFENYVVVKMSQKGYDNDYLANVKSWDDWGNKNPERYPYLRPDEIAPVEEAFDNLFGVIETKETDKGVALFSADNTPPDPDNFTTSTEPATGGFSVSEVRKAVADQVLKLSQAYIRRVEVVEGVANLPDDIRVAAEEVGNVAGAYSSENDLAYIIAENIKSQAHARRVLAHEVTGHMGMEDMLGEEYTGLTKQVLFMKDAGNKAVNEAAATVETRRGKLDANEEAAEIIAVMAEQGIRSPLMKRVIAAVRKFLRKLGFSLTFSTTELEALIAKAGRYVQTAREGQVRARKNQSPMFSNDDDSSDRNYTDDQRDALRKGGFGKGKKADTFKARFEDAKHRFGTKLRQGVVDQFASFKEILGDDRAWMMAQLTGSSTGALDAAINHGMPFIEDNAIGVNTKEKSLKDILKPLGTEMDDWFAWIAGNRAAQLKESDRERLFSDVNIESLKSLNQGKMKDGKSRAEVYEAVRIDFEKMNDAITAIAEETGLVGSTERAAWSEAGFYVPFYRMLDNEDSKARGPQVFGGGLARQTAYKKLKGADIPLDDLLSNVLLNWSHLLGASLKNQSAVKALDSATEMGIAEEVPKAIKGKKAIFVRKDGKEVWYELDESQDGSLVLDSLMSLNWNGLNTTLMKGLRKFKRALTIGVTASPSFKVRNLLRDSVQAIAVADMSTQIHKNLYQGWKATRKDSDTNAQMLAGGGAFGDSGYIHGADPDAIKHLVNKGVRRETILDKRKHITKLWDAYQDFGARMENVNRAANYEQALEKGKDRLEANFEARDHLDFARTGAFVAVRAIAQSVSFLNARAQGLDKLYRSGMDPKQRKQFTAVVGTYALASVALYLMMKDDEDYKDAQQWERDSYHLFKVPGSDVMYRFPRPFEVGAIASLMERVTEQMVDDDVHGELFAERLGHTLKETFSFNPMPQAFQPAIEIYANKNSFTGQSIEGMSMKRLPAADRKRAWTSETAIWTSGRMDDISWGKIVLSPVQIEHLVKGYLGWAGATTLGAIDLLVTRPLSDSPSKPARKVTEYPVIKSFAREMPARSTKYVSLFYERLREIDQAYAGIRDAREAGDAERAMELLDESRDKLKWRQQYNRVQKQLGKINKRISQIQLSREMDPDKKREEIDRLTIIKNRYTRIIDEKSSKDLH